MLTAIPSNNSIKNQNWFPVSIFVRNRYDNSINAAISEKNNIVYSIFILKAALTPQNMPAAYGQLLFAFFVSIPVTWRLFTAAILFVLNRW
jgi:hypothetical protein